MSFLCHNKISTIEIFFMKAFSRAIGILSAHIPKACINYLLIPLYIFCRVFDLKKKVSIIRDWIIYFVGPKPRSLCEEGKIISITLGHCIANCEKKPFLLLIYIKTFQGIPILFANDFYFVRGTYNNSGIDSRLRFR